MTSKDDAINGIITIFKTDIQRKSPATISYYESVARKFLEYSNGDLTRAGVMRFFTDSGYCDNSLRAVYYVLKHLYKALDRKFPLDKDDLPALPDEEDINAPTMSPDNIQRLIQRWRNSPGEYITSLVFLSTIYGLRSIEMIDVEVGQKTIMVDVAKRKRKVYREHILPDKTRIFLDGYQHLSESMVSYSYSGAVKNAGIAKRDGERWHSIRRSLFTACIDSGIPRVLAKRFFRWAKDNRDMSDQYYHHTFDVTNQIMFGLIPMPLSDPVKYVKHPYLHHWLE